MFCRQLYRPSRSLIRLFSLLMLGIPLLTLFSCSRLGPMAGHEHFVLIGTNDFHGFLRPVENKIGNETLRANGAEWFAGHVRILERKYGDGLILLDGGDVFQGTIESNSVKGNSVVDYYNELPYRAAAIGNHEFDYGPKDANDKDPLGAIRSLMARSKFPWLAANIYYKGTRKNWTEKNLYPSLMFTAKGVKFGVIGLTTETTPVKTKPQYVRDLEFGDLAEATLREAKKLRADGAEVILVTAHEGGEKLGEPMHAMLKKLPPGTVDAIVAGHTHTQINEFVLGVPVIESRTRGEFFGRVDLYFDKTSRKINTSLTKISPMHAICGNWFANEESCSIRNARTAIQEGRAAEKDFLPLRNALYEKNIVEADSRVRSVLRPYFQSVDELRLEKLGRAERDFKRFTSGESETGQFYTGALLQMFPQVKVVYLNGGSFRKQFSKGEITYGELYEVMPFDNAAVLVEANGKILRQMLEIGTSGTHTIPALAGVTFSYRGNPNQKTDLVKPQKRLVDIRWAHNGKPVKDSDRFILLTNDYLLEGGDNMDKVFGSMGREKFRYQERAIRDLVADYLRRDKNILLPREEKPRITMLP